MEGAARSGTGDTDLHAVGSLGDDALVTAGADLFEDRGAAARDMLAVEENLALAGALHEVAQRLLAFKKRPVPQVLAVERQAVEDEAGERTAFAQGTLEGREIGATLVVEGDDLAVEPCIPAVQRGGGFGNLRELFGPVPLVARPAGRLAASDRDQDAVAVELHLVQPVAPIRRFVDHSDVQGKGLVPDIVRMLLDGLADILIAHSAFATGCDTGITFDKGAAKLPFFNLLK